MSKWGSGETKKCIVCNKVFYVPPCHSYLKCCSRKCGYVYRGQSNTGRTHFKKGMVPWNKGKPAPWAKKEGLEFGRGWNKGLGMATKDTRLRWSRKYVAWRKKIFERDNYTCQGCNTRGGKLQAHHIKSFALYPKLRFDLNNGQTLCIPCHKKTDNYGRFTKKSMGL